MKGDLTQGPICRQLVTLALPLLASNILQQLYNTVDTAVVGYYAGNTAFAAAGVAGSVMNLFLFLISGCCTGVGILFSQYHGAGDEAACRQEVFHAAVFGGVFSLMGTALAFLTVSPLLRLLKTPATVTPFVLDYLRIIFLGFLPVFVYNLGFSVLRSVGNTRMALVFLSLSMSTNLVLDLVFVKRWGIAGAAWATILAETMAAMLCLLYLERRCPQLICRRADMVYDTAMMRRTVRFSLTSAMHMCSLYIGKLLVQGTVNTLGTDAISAYTAATRIEGFANSFGDSGAAAMSVFIGQNTGAGSGQRIREGFRIGEYLLAGLGLFMSAVMILFAVPCLRLVLPEDGSLPAALGYLQLIACFYLFNFLGSGLAGYFQGRGMVNIPTLGATGHITLRVVLSALLASRMGLPAVALASGLGWMGVVAVWFVLLSRDWRALPETV